jgi:hypothetical protein
VANRVGDRRGQWLSHVQLPHAHHAAQHRSRGLPVPLALAVAVAFAFALALAGPVWYVFE